MLEIGQKLFVPAERHSISRTVTITKVGRKWAEIGNKGYRIDMATMRLHNGYTSPKVYTSKKAWIADVGLERDWEDLKRQIARKKHSDVTKEEMDAIRDILNIEPMSSTIAYFERKLEKMKEQRKC